MKRPQAFWRTLLGTLLTLLLLAASSAAQEKVWVVSKDAKLKAADAASSATVADLAVGTELTVETTQGKWYKVSTPARQTGWIYRGKVGTTPPAGAGGGLFGSLSGGSSIQVSKADTSRSIRGLSPEAQEYARIAGTPETYRAALDGVLTLKTDTAEIERFLKDGRIGEYAP
jgi:hypothetical protein